jgi:hypothetical protein
MRAKVIRGNCPCGNPLGRKQSKFCSKECESITRSIELDKREERTCEQCRQAFKVKKSRRVGKFCSLKCYWSSMRSPLDFVCAKCGVPKKAADFYVDRSKPRGHMPNCKTCQAGTFGSVVVFTPNYRIRTIRGGAVKRKLAYSLSRDEFMSFWKKPCVYCGDDIETVGLDRIDNLQGYIVGNVVACCATCNRMKSDMSMDEFLERCGRISARATTSSASLTHSGKY